MGPVESHPNLFVGGAICFEQQNYALAENHWTNHHCGDNQTITILGTKITRGSLNTIKFEEDKLHLNLQKNAAGIFECRGRIELST